MVSDMMFQAYGSELFDDRSHSGLWGDVILVNGRPWPVMKVQRRVYRFRVLDASISRSYRFTLAPPAPVWVVATDAGLVPRSQQSPNGATAPWNDTKSSSTSRSSRPVNASNSGT